MIDTRHRTTRHRTTRHRTGRIRGPFSPWWLVAAIASSGAAARADDAAARLAHGARLRAEGNAREAFAWVDQSFRMKPTYAALMERGRVWFDLGEDDRALNDFRDAQKWEPDDPEPHWLQAKVWWKKGKFEEAESEFTWALHAKGDHFPSVLHRGFLRTAMGNATGAAADGETAVLLEPANIAAYRLRGRARQELGDWAGAERDYDRIVQETPEDPGAYALRAEARLALNNLEGAWLDAERIRQLHPADARAARFRGNVYRARSNAAQAEQELNKAVHLAKPDERAAVHFDRGLARLDLGRTDEALADLRECLKLAPERKDQFTRRFEQALAARGR